MIYKDYIKKMEKDRFAADLKEAQDALANMNGRLHDLEAGGDDKLATIPLQQQVFSAWIPKSVNSKHCLEDQKNWEGLKKFEH